MRTGKREIPVKAGRTVRFIDNEPPKRVPGGAVRKSTTISRKGYPAIRRRQQLDRILLSHCPSDTIQNLLKPADEAILHRIIQETVACGANIVARKNAIWALRFYPTVDSVNALTDLAEVGEDEYVRSYAVESLGALSVRAALPVLVRGLEDSSDLVNRAAMMAIGSMVDHFGEEIILAVGRRAGSARARQRVEEIVRSKARKGTAARKQPRMRTASRD